MRQPFNTTCDLYEGPGGAIPLALRGTFDCRLVFEDAITTIGTGAPDIPYYLTIQGIVPKGYWTSETGIGDFAKADLVAVPSGSPIRFRVLYVDEINWLSQPTYFRAYLVEAVYITVHVCGGAVPSGSATVIFPITLTREIFGCGAVLAVGAAAPNFSTYFRACGGCSASGAGVLFRPLNYISVACGVAAIGTGQATIVYTPPTPPTVYWEDTFTDTNGTNLDSHTPEVGTSYTTAFGSMQCYNSQCTMLTPSADFSTVSFDPAVTQGTITFTFRVQPQSEESGQRTFYYKIRSNAVDDYFSFIFNWDASTDTSDNWIIEKTTGGVPATVATSTGTLAADTDYVVEIVDSGTDIDITVDGELLNTSDSDFNGNTIQVIQFFSAGPTNDRPRITDLLFVP